MPSREHAGGSLAQPEAGTEAGCPSPSAAEATVRLYLRRNWNLLQVFKQCDLWFETIILAQYSLLQCMSEWLVGLFVWIADFLVPYVWCWVRASAFLTRCQLVLMPIPPVLGTTLENRWSTARCVNRKDRK